MDKKNITLWTEFEDILHKFSEEQDEQDSSSRPCDKYQNQVDPSGDPPQGYQTNVMKRTSHYHYGGCDCKIENNIIDLGSHHFPRYLMNAACEDNRESSNRKCSQGSKCKPIEYNVSVLTVRSRRKRVDESKQSHPVPQMLRSHFKFNVVTVIAGCICSQM